MATTHTYSGGKNTYIYYKGDKMAMDSFTVAEDIPGEAISNVGDSYGDAGSAGIILYSGSFSGPGQPKMHGASGTGRALGRRHQKAMNGGYRPPSRQRRDCAGISTPPRR